MSFWPPGSLSSPGFSRSPFSFLMNLLKRISFLPFLLYRVMLGAFLLVLLYG
jgi:hypothetical protein